MPFYIRRSVKFGPFRVNLSKSGLGYSAGVRGARFSTGPRGTFVHMGRGGIYYRQRILGAHPDRGTKEDTKRGEGTRSEQADDPSFPPDASSAESLARINKSIERTSLTLLWALGLLAGVILLIFLGLGTLALLILLVSPIPLFLAKRSDQRRRTTVVTYELDEDARARFAEIQRACETLASANSVWRIDDKQHTENWRYHAGANNLFSRHRARIATLRPPYIETNVTVWGMEVGKLRLFFLPDRLFALQGNKYSAASYVSIRPSFRAIDFREGEAVPRDAKILGYTWQYVNKNGTPDRRFKINCQIPILQYGEVGLSTGPEFTLGLLVSNVSAAEQFWRAIEHAAYGSTHQDTRQEHADWGRREAPRRPAPSSRTKSPFEVLGVRDGATHDEIVAAYRKLARMYHPDRVADLGPELREVAERRMKEINAAYEAVRGRL